MTREAWTLLAIFIATIVGSIVQPLTGSAMVLLGVVALALFRRGADRKGAERLCGQVCLARARGILYLAGDDQDRAWAIASR